ncbi:MAG: RraA family protein [Paracoccus denitrificans]|uniref:Putative 4-hydroxy-4-methyl-2-oxoglutarate aldolase n=1 Tax=Paracoccus denitrificans TaxID=266 RepID=A0A533I1T3_PARDE|nr:MAG: RraA family protein [Paracoccus denitrificans]
MYQIGPMPDPIAPDALASLRECEPATIGHFREEGFVDPGISCRLEGAWIAGTAVTISLPAGDGTLLNHAMRLVRPGDILVIDLRGDRQHACWGGVLTETAKIAGLAGVVIDGMATDIAAIRQQKLPVWSRGLAAKTTKLRNLGGSMNQPTVVGGVAVHPGDAILADENGVLVLPPDQLSAITTRTLQMQADELQLLKRLHAGEVLPEISGASAMVAADAQPRGT